VTIHTYEGLIYEPRSFWDVKRVTATSETQAVFFDTRNAFLNGERYPVEISEISLAPINYMAQANLAPLNGRFSGGSCFEVAKATIAVRQRQNYSRFAMDLRSYSPSRTQAPQTSYYSDGTNDLTNASSLFGVCHKRFDRPFVLPQFGSAELQLSTYYGAAPAGGAAQPVAFSAAWYEAGGLQEGSMRVLNQRALLDATTPESALYGANIPNAGEFPSLVATPATFPPQHLFTAKDFRAQSPTGQGSQRFSGVAVHIDQIAYDGNFSGGAFPPIDASMTPLSLRAGCRIRSVDGGSKADWWRPGAPIALVFTHVTPAQVYKLPRPITLMPGDQLEVELNIPAQTPADVNAETYSIGIAFNGYAAIEG
jgi:hypothetical protein